MRDAVDEVAQHETAARVAVRDQRQRGKEVLAELAIGRPWLGRRSDLEAEAVDQDRSTGVELDVVRARVLEPHPGVQGARLQLDGQERGLLQLRERPLVRIRDDVDHARPDDGDGCRAAPASSSGSSWCSTIRPVGGQSLVEPGGSERLPVRGAGRLDLAVQDPFASEDEAGWIAERRRIHHRRVSDRCGRPRRRRRAWLPRGFRGSGASCR